MGGIADLITRVEAATGADRELDDAIEAEIGDWINLGGWQRKHKATGVVESYSYRQAPAYTASLDAAMSLVPEGWCFTIGQSVGFSAVADLWIAGKVPGIHQAADTPAIALTAAALRARDVEA